MSHLNSEINVTPLVDVCLVLLIIFMVVLPSMVNGIPVQLPDIARSEPLDEKVFPVTVKADGTVYLERLVVRSDEVPAALKNLRATAATRPVAIRADKRASYGDVVDVLGACRDAGWQDVTLVSTTTTRR
jgi:biopolymer transport protein ExbD